MFEEDQGYFSLPPKIIEPELASALIKLSLKKNSLINFNLFVLEGSSSHLRL